VNKLKFSPPVVKTVEIFYFLRSKNFASIVKEAENSNFPQKNPALLKQSTKRTSFHYYNITSGTLCVSSELRQKKKVN